MPSLPRKKRVLFITHALESLYGASTSLRLLLKNYDSIEADILVHRSLRRPRDLLAAAAPFSAVRNVYEMALPLDLESVGIKLSIRQKLVGQIYRLAWMRDRRKLYDLIRRNSYDVIHLNSPVLHDVVTDDLPFVIHIRDIIQDVASPIPAKLCKGHGLIFIDATTRVPFERVIDDTPNIVLNNPIDMADIHQYQGLFEHPLLTPKTTVFSVIGRVSEIKGVELIIAAFRQGADNDCVLLVVGDGSAKYLARCRTAAQGDRRIVFCGEEREVKKIYAVTDWVVRGDPRGCIGRTVYEGLYAGSRVIMPGLGEPAFLFEADRYKDDIFLYESRNVASLAGAFAANKRKKVLTREGESNIQNYVKEFDAFLEDYLSHTTAHKAGPFSTVTDGSLQDFRPTP